MDTEFQPLYEAKDKDDFSIWELQVPEADMEPKIDLQAQLAAECEQLREEARHEGYQQGLQDAENDIKAQQAELRQWLAMIQNPLQLLDKQISDEMMQTIFWICKACISIELSLAPEKILMILEDIKKELPAIIGKKQLSMNPQDKQWLETQLDRKLDADILAILVEDKKLNRGDFYLHSDHCELDGCLEDRLQKILASYLPIPLSDEHA